MLSWVSDCRPYNTCSGHDARKLGKENHDCKITSGGEEDEEFKEALTSGNTGEIEGWRESYIAPFYLHHFKYPFWSKVVYSAQRNFVGNSPPQTSPKCLAVYLAVNWSMPHKILQVHLEPSLVPTSRCDPLRRRTSLRQYRVNLGHDAIHEKVKSRCFHY